MLIIYLLGVFCCAYFLGYFVARQEKNEALLYQKDEIERELNIIKKSHENLKDRYKQAFKLIDKEYIPLDRYVVKTVYGKGKSRNDIMGYKVRDLASCEKDIFFRNYNVANNTARKLNKNSKSHH